MKRFTIMLPEDLDARFKIACTLEGTDTSEIVRRCIEEYVAGVAQRKMIPFEREERAGTRKTRKSPKAVRRGARRPASSG